jgi:hypothetical protein
MTTNPFGKLRRFLFGKKKPPKDIRRLKAQIESLALLLGRSMSWAVQKKGVVDDLSQVEFRVFSQFDDDGIIQYLVHHLQIVSKNFVEFGVENYLESNTRFLLMNNNWKGLVLDGSPRRIAVIQSSPLYWKYDLTAIPAFVTRDNINTLIKSAGFEGELGLLHIDIDGNDYWLWQALDVVQPTIAIVEYNSLFGVERAITIPYAAEFDRTRAHPSYLYFGASLLALCDLAETKGYAFIGCNSHGNNAYFVRKDKLGALKPVDPRQGYRLSKFRESRNSQGRFSFLSGNERFKMIQGLPVINTRTQQAESL